MKTVTLLSLGSALLLGLLMSRLAKKLQLPAVTAYLVTGVLIGPFCLGALGLSGVGFHDEAQIESLGILSDVALGFIAFAIGNEFRLSQLRQTGRQATVIGIVQAFVATLFVDAALIALHFIMPEHISLSAAITLGAIASATAPAATLMVVRQYKAKGPLTSLLLPIVALDDAVGLVIFSVSFGIARALQTGSPDFISIIVEPLIEIVASLILGTLMSLALTYFEKFFHSRSKRLSLAVTFVFLTVGLTMLHFEIGGVKIGFSSLLTCMMLGTVFCNLCDFSEELMDRCDRWTAPLFILFFVISGAELKLSVFTSGAVVLIGVLFIIFRSIGKYLGSYFSAKSVVCDQNTVKYLGITLLPQAGVALGMSVTAMQLGETDGSLVRNIVLFAVLIYELIGPLLTKLSLSAAGEIAHHEKTSSRGKAVH
ncbi:MAG: cation:proton antiporter [Oscillospiraceae bacterium]|nr:cation:proton antiporter [Oscillospiraceae bacterium]